MHDYLPRILVAQGYSPCMKWMNLHADPSRTWCDALPLLLYQQHTKLALPSLRFRHVSHTRPSTQPRADSGCYVRSPTLIGISDDKGMSGGRTP